MDADGDVVRVSAAPPPGKRPLFKRNFKRPSAKPRQEPLPPKPDRPVGASDDDDDDDLGLFKHSKELFPTIMKERRPAPHDRDDDHDDDGEKENHSRKRRKVPTSHDDSDTDLYNVSDREIERARKAKHEQDRTEQDGEKKRPTTPKFTDILKASPGSSGKKVDKGKGLAAPYSLTTPKPAKPKASISKSPRSGGGGSGSSSKMAAANTIVLSSSSDDESEAEVGVTKRKLRSSRASRTPSKRRRRDKGNDDDRNDDFATSQDFEDDGGDLEVLSTTANSKKAVYDEEKDDTEVEEMVNPEYAKFILAAKQRLSAQQAANDKRLTADGSPAPDTPESTVIQVIITSRLGGAQMDPIIVKRRVSQALKAVREAFVSYAPSKGRWLSQEERDGTFLTWKGRKVFDVSTVASLGVLPDAGGVFRTSSHPGSREAHGDGFQGGLLHLEAWTNETYDAWQKQEDKQRRRNLGEEVSSDEEGGEGGGSDTNDGDDDNDGVVNGGSTAAPGNESGSSHNKLKIILKSKHYEPLKMSVYQSTPVSTLIAAFRVQRLDNDADKEVSLYWDGERLDEDAVMADTEIEDMETVEVYIKGRD